MTDENCRMSHRHGKAWLHGSMRFIHENECKPDPVMTRRVVYLLALWWVWLVLAVRCAAN